MTNKDEAVAMAALTVLRDAIDMEIEKMRLSQQSRLFTLADDNGTKTVPVEFNGKEVAAMNIVESKPKFTIDNEEQFTDFVERMWGKEAIETIQRVKPAFVKNVLANLELVDGKVTDNVTGAVAAGVKASASKRYLSLRFKPFGKDELLYGLWTQKLAIPEDLLPQKPVITYEAEYEEE